MPSISCDSQGRAHLVDQRAGSSRSASQTAAVRLWLYGTSTRIEERPVEGRRSGSALRLLRIEKPQGGAKTVALSQAVLELGNCVRFVSTVEGAVASRLALDPVSLDQLEHERRRLAERLQQTLGASSSQRTPDVVRGQPEAGIHQPNVAARIRRGRPSRPREGRPKIPASPPRVLRRSRCSRRR